MHSTDSAGKMQNSEPDSKNTEQAGIHRCSERTVKELHVLIEAFARSDPGRQVHLSPVVDNGLGPPMPGPYQHDDQAKGKQSYCPKIREMG